MRKGIREEKEIANPEVLKSPKVSKAIVRQQVSVSKQKSLLFVLVLVVLDQASKAWALKYIVTTCNAGSAFGLPIASVYITVLILLIISWFFARNKKPINTLPLVLILAGGFSNLIDRITHGCVVDFIALGFWPSFNLADALISVGVLLLALNILRSEKNAA